MKNLLLGFGAISIFVVGGFVGGQIIDRDKSIFVEVDFGDFGRILLGKQLDLIDLAGWDIVDKSILITGIKNLPPEDQLSIAILDLEKTEAGLFTPKKFEVKVHVTDDPKLHNNRASICETNSADFYTKELTIFDSFPPKRLIRVGVWDKVKSGLCVDKNSHHIWVHLDTVKTLYPDNSISLSDGSDLELTGLVSNSCMIPQEVS